MRYLLDTCAIVYVVEGTGDLSAAAEQSLRDVGAEGIVVSAVSIAEIACLQERGRIKLKVHWRLWWNETLQRTGWGCLPITAEIMAEAYSLAQPVHRDPADRVLIATARLEKLTLVTTDRQILSYPHVSTLR